MWSRCYWPRRVVLADPPSRTKRCALRVFIVVRHVLAQAHSAGRDIAEAWKESEGYRP